jgi:hypothetical protein
MKATTNAHVTRLSSLVVEMAESVIMAKLKVIEERHHKDKSLYSVDLEGTLCKGH